MARGWKEPCKLHVKLTYLAVGEDTMRRAETDGTASTAAVPTGTPFLGTEEHYTCSEIGPGWGFERHRPVSAQTPVYGR